MKRYPEAPGNKGGGASLLAAHKITPAAGSIKERVLACYQRNRYGMTPDQCAQMINEDKLNVRPRVSELVAEAKLVKTPALHRDVTGKTQHIFVAKCNVGRRG